MILSHLRISAKHSDLALNSHVCLICRISHTTKKPNPEETPGKDYHFVNIDQFEQAVKMVRKTKLLSSRLQQYI